MPRALDHTKINAVVSILVKLEASYSRGVTVRQVLDIMEADPDDYPMSTHWVRKYMESDEFAAWGIVRSARQRQPFEYYYDKQRGAFHEAKTEIMTSATVTEDLANVLVAMEERLLEAIKGAGHSTGTNAKMPKHQYYAFKFFEKTEEDKVLKLMERPKPSELGVTTEQWEACIGSMLRQGKSKIGGKKKSD